MDSVEARSGIKKVKTGTAGSEDLNIWNTRPLETGSWTMLYESRLRSILAAIWATTNPFWVASS